MIRVVIADDHAIVRAGVRAVLAFEPDVEVVDEAADGRSLIDAVARHAPDVAVVDLAMPGMNGVEAIGRLRDAAPPTRVVVLSMHAGADYVRPALRAGARGYVVKGAGIDDLVRAIRAVCAGETFLDAAAAEAAEAPGSPAAAGAGGDDLAGLTPREREVLQMVAEGRTNREMASALGVSPKTVDAHRTNLMRKLGIHDAQGLTRLAVRAKIVSD